MMMVLQRIDADHNVTYGELSFLNQSVVTLEPSFPCKHKKMVGRIPTGTYVARLEGMEIVIDDVPGFERVIIATGATIKDTNGSPFVGTNRGKLYGTIDGSLDAWAEVFDAMQDHSKEECFLDVRDVQ